MILRNSVFSTLECLYFLCFLQSYSISMGKIKLQMESNLLFLDTASCKDMKYTKILKFNFLAKNGLFWPKNAQKLIFIFGTAPDVKPYHIRT